MAHDPAAIAAILDRAMTVIDEEPELARLPRLEQRRRLARAQFRRLRDRVVAPRES